MTLEDAVRLLRRMLDPEDLGYAVSEEVRNEIRKFLRGAA